MPVPTTNHWICVASANHVRRGVAGGFMQVNHGKRAPLARMRPGDGVAYYSPTETFGEKDWLQAFTAIGTVAAGDPYLFDMGGGFVPFRRDVIWDPAQTTAIRPLLPALALTAGHNHWGQVFRFGVVRISAADFHKIAAAMQARTLCPPSVSPDPA